MTPSPSPQGLYPVVSCVLKAQASRRLPICCLSLLLLAASLAGMWLALGEADVVLGGLEGLQPPLHVLLEDLLVLPLLRILGDEVVAAAGFIPKMLDPCQSGEKSLVACHRALSSALACSTFVC